MGKGHRTNLYIVCAVLFPLAFAAFVVGFGCPAWQANSGRNAGLWQECEVVFENCTTLDFDDGGDWMIGVRAVEIFALVMFVAAAVNITYENCCTNFRGRPLSERLGSGITCILGGLGGLSGIIVFVVKTNDSSITYAWAFALVAASSALAVILGVGFCISGFFFESKRKHEHPKGQINGRAPHLTSNDENYEVTAFTNRTMYDDRGAPLPANDNLPGFAIYNGMLNQPGQRSSLPLGVSTTSALPPPNLNGRGGGGGGGFPPMHSKQSQYYSLSDDRLLDPGFDLSEGFSYVPSRARPSARGQDNPYYSRESPYARAGVRSAEDPYSRGGGRLEDPYSRGGGRSEDPYSRGAREEDPYNRIHRAPRAGYNDPYGFDRLPGGRGGVEGPYDRGNYGRSNVPRDSFYRPGKF